MYKVSRPLGLIWSELWAEPLFRLGVAFKLLLIFFLLPTIQQEWFVPFIVNWIESPTLVPWSSYLKSGGEPLAFPYGPVMLISHLPPTIAGWLVDQLFGYEYFANFGFRCSLLAADLLLLVTLLQAFENHWKKILIFYWLSPLVIFITYWHGQTDIIPVALFFCSLALVKKGNYWFAGVVLALSIAAKHSMLIGVPFIMLYLWSHNSINKEFQRFAGFFVVSLLLIEAPFFLSEAFRMMVLDNREAGKIYWLFINMGKESLIFLTPLVYVLLLYSFWRIRRINFDLLLAAMGVAFSVIILMTPSPPGWYLWLVPIFALHQSRYGGGAVAIISTFYLLFISFHLLYTSGANFLLFDISISSISLPNISNIKSI